jgi:hypothetical protein
MQHMLFFLQHFPNEKRQFSPKPISISILRNVRQMANLKGKVLQLQKRRISMPHLVLRPRFHKLGGYGEGYHD